MESNLLELTQACFNKVESEIFTTKHNSPTKTMLNLLETNGFKSLYDFTLFLINKYNTDINPDEIFIPNDYGTFVVLTNQRETLLNFFKSVIRDLQLNQIIRE
jgi:hypothetical protein